MKDRIDSQILTHYPKTISVSKEITRQESELSAEQCDSITRSELMESLVEQISFEARQSEYIDSKSGVSARLTISAFENLNSTAERRMIINNESVTSLRISDIYGVIPSITGKIELVYEGEQEGPSKVAYILISKAVKTLFQDYFPSPEKIKKNQELNPYLAISNWFSKGNTVDILNTISDKEYERVLTSVPGLKEIVKKYHPHEKGKDQLLLMEFVLHGLAEYSMLSKYKLEYGLQFKDMLSSMFSINDSEDEDDQNITGTDDFYR